MLSYIISHFTVEQPTLNHVGKNCKQFGVRIPEVVHKNPSLLTWIFLFVSEPALQTLGN